METTSQTTDILGIQTFASTVFVPDSRPVIRRRIPGDTLTAALSEHQVPQAMFVVLNGVFYKIYMAGSCGRVNEIWLCTW